MSLTSRRIEKGDGLADAGDAEQPLHVGVGHEVRVQALLEPFDLRVE